MNPAFWLLVAFLMSWIDVFQATAQCQPSVEYSIKGMFLRGHTFKTYKTERHGSCYFRCAEEVTCQSHNYVIGQNLCELNNRTKEARPEDFKPDQSRFYMKRARNRAPLGSIQDLPAESCSEIKASEGNEMVNGDYWIYSDGNSQTILARCEGRLQIVSLTETKSKEITGIHSRPQTLRFLDCAQKRRLGSRMGHKHIRKAEEAKGTWQKMNTEPVCFGSRSNRYGAFNIAKTGHLKTMKLVHRSGSIKCNPDDPASYWGCRYVEYNKNALLTIITKSNRKAFLPPAGDLKVRNDEGCRNEKHFYYLDGITHTSPELLFSHLPNPLSVSRNQELQIWYGQDWADCSELNNDGTTCVDVYAMYA